MLYYNGLSFIYDNRSSFEFLNMKKKILRKFIRKDK